MPAHIHVFIGFKATIAIVNLVWDIKANSSKFINDEHFLRGKFAWQDAYGCFTYAHSQLDVLAK
jgi:REP element-mobilizing transposase RayT